MFYDRLETDSVQRRPLSSLYERMKGRPKLLVIVFTVFYFVTLASAILISRLYTSNSSQDYYSELIHDGSSDSTIRDYLLNGIQSSNIEANLKYLTSMPHSAGTEEGINVAQYVHDTWKSLDMDFVKIIDYDVYLEFPDQEKFNNIEFKWMNDTIERTVEIVETVFDHELNYTHITKPFLAYSQIGSVTSDQIYYANYCNKEDFEYLIQNGLNLTDQIVLCRYGLSFRGNKIKHAEKYGVKSVLLFDDPLRSASSNSSYYPNGVFLNGDGTQRGTIFLKDGDPLTPLYPSTHYMHRLNASQQKDLTNIVAQVIGYDLATEVLNSYECTKQSPAMWKGFLNSSYCLGGKLKGDRKITVNVFGEKKIKKIQNVMGIIKGSLEPDRYIMIGNHRDAWTFGSVDPSSGTAILLEVARSFAMLKKEKNWSPRRSIIFLSWDAEEYGLIGSTEWTEEYLKKLVDNSIVYLNNDLGLSGSYSYESKASPLLHSVIKNVTKTIQYDDRISVYDRWLENNPNNNKTEPRVFSLMGSNSDHTAFLQRAGIPCIDHRFVRDSKDKRFKYLGGSYPLYHTSYETFSMVKKFMDPDFHASKLLGQIIAELTRVLSTSLVLPFNVTTYGVELDSYLNSFKSSYQSKLAEFNVTLVDLERSIDAFNQEAQSFDQRVKSFDRTKYHLVRLYNDQMKNIERGFLDTWWLKETGYMHQLSAPSPDNKYVSTIFPFVANAIDNLASNKNQSLHNSLLDQVKFQLSILIYSINSATAVLKEPVDFSRDL